MTILVPDDKLDCLGILRKHFGLGKNGLAFYPGPVLPRRADGSPLSSLYTCDILLKLKLTQINRSHKLNLQMDSYPKG